MNLHKRLDTVLSSLEKLGFSKIANELRLVRASEVTPVYRLPRQSRSELAKKFHVDLAKYAKDDLKMIGDGKFDSYDKIMTAIRNRLNGDPLDTVVNKSGGASLKMLWHSGMEFGMLKNEDDTYSLQFRDPDGGKWASFGTMRYDSEGAAQKAASKDAPSTVLKQLTEMMAIAKEHTIKLMEQMAERLNAPGKPAQPVTKK